MHVRLGPGPVFFFECVQTARRWQTYAVRAGFVAGLLVSLVVAWLTRVGDGGPVTLAGLAAVGEVIFYALVGTQIALVLLAAPAYTAGAVCMDKARGNLTHLLTTDLSSAEIVLGKLFSRLLPAVGLVVVALPVLALATLLGGIDPEALFGAFAVSLAVAVFGCTLALTLSVWGRKTHEVLLATYLILTILLLAYPASRLLPAAWGVGSMLDWTETLNPFYVAFGPYLRPGSFSWEPYAYFVGGALGLSAVLAFLAVARLRAVVRHQEGRPERRRAARRGFALPAFLGPSLDVNPVLWREWHRRRPSRWMRFVWGVYVVMALGAAGLALSSFTPFLGLGSGIAAFVNAFVFSIGLLLVSITSVTSLQEERARGSLDVLLTTPLPTSTIVWGKWWGAYRSAVMLALIPLGLGIGVSIVGRSTDGELRPFAVAVLLGLMLSYGAAVTSLGLGLATWIRGFGRAVAVSVSAYVLVTAGLVFLLIATNTHGPEIEGLAMGSPWFGVGQLTFRLGETHDLGASIGWGVGWGLAYLVAAGVLLALTLSTFDACLGRVTPVYRLPQPRPARRRLDQRTLSGGR